MTVTLQQRSDIVGECIMISKDFLEAANAVRNSQYAAFATQLDQVSEKFDALKARVVPVETS